MSIKERTPIRVPNIKNPRPQPTFIGMPEPPKVCPRDRCGQQVALYVSVDPQEPITWACVVGHGGVVNVPPLLRQPPLTIPKGICQRCATAPVPEKRRRGGYRGGYCDACIEEGRRLFAAEDKEVSL